MIKAYRKWKKQKHELIFEKWFADKGDATLRLDYPLSGNDVVFDVGGYRGDWTAHILSRHSPQVHIFEPVGEFANKIEARFQGNPKVTLHRFGLDGQDHEAKIALLEDGTSTFRAGQNFEQIQLKEAKKILEAFDEVALIKINIEGGEYDLLLHLLQHDLVKKVRHIQVQFHLDIPRARHMRRKIRRQLRRTHRCAYNYPFVWESWSRIQDE